MKKVRAIRFGTPARAANQQTIRTAVARTLVRLLGLGLAAGLVGAGSARAAPSPNIVIIMVDDMGFSDVGCYGGEIETPHLDRLAKQGLRFSQFYNTGRCCPTRASLLTGLYAHQAGIGHMSGNRGFPAYQGYLNQSCLTLAEALKPAGYFTAISGKWHVGGNSDHWPLRRGFDRFYGIPQGGGHHYRTLPGRQLVVDETPIDIPAGWYTTTAFTDHAVQFIEEGHAANRPILLYLAYTAPHWPLQAPPEVTAQFVDRYRDGWEARRQARFERQRAMGLFGPETTLPPQDAQAPAWSTVNDRTEMVLRLALHAAMVHLIDEGVGRVVSTLRELGALDNTLLLFLSDNGASAEGGPTGFVRRDRGDPAAVTGSPDSYVSYGVAGANLCDTPFRKYKMYTHEGGIATPLIAHWPNGIPTHLRGGFSREVGHVIDLLPTCLDLAGQSYPTDRRDSPLTPLPGLSLLPALQGEPLGRRELFFEHEGNAAVRTGPWKLVRTHNQPWELYNLDTDRTEMTDLAGANPDRVTELQTAWKTWADRVGVRPWPIRRDTP